MNNKMEEIDDTAINYTAITGLIKDLLDDTELYEKSLDKVFETTYHLNIKQRILDDVSQTNVVKGLTGKNQQERDAQLAILVEKEQREVEDAKDQVNVAKLDLEKKSENLSSTKIICKLITATLSALSLKEDSSQIKDFTDKDAKDFSDKF